MTYVLSHPARPDTFDRIAIHRSCATHARDAYFREYGVYHTADPQYVTGNDRHTFWLAAFDARQQALILDPHQS